MSLTVAWAQLLPRRSRYSEATAQNKTHTQNKEIWKIKDKIREFPVVQRLGLGTFTSMGPGLIPDQGTKMPCNVTK